MKNQISWNDKVTVELNEHGREIYQNFYRDINMPVDMIPPLPEDNKITKQLHFLAMVFGESLGVGGKLPFKDTTILLEK